LSGLPQNLSIEEVYRMEPIIDFDKVDEHGPQTFRGTLEIDLSELDRDEVEKLGKVEIETTVRKGEGGEAEYLADGNVSYEADLRCARCIEPYPFANSSPFTVRFRPLPLGSDSEEEIEISANELEVEFYRERKIPIRQLATEQIQLSLPMKPLCEERCQGLCPQCGANLNRGGCDCGDRATDGRWDALKDIRDQIAKKKDI
jgi:uncharacterized protein